MSLKPQKIEITVSFRPEKNAQCETVKLTHSYTCSKAKQVAALYTAIDDLAEFEGSSTTTVSKCVR